MQASPAVLRRLVCVVLLLLAGSATAQVRGERDLALAHLLACPTCEGSGEVEVLCWYCRGEKRTCPQSGYRKPSYPRRWQRAWLPATWWELIGELSAEDVEGGDSARQRLARHLGVRAHELEPVREPSHELACTAGCTDGKLLLEGEWIDCRLCTRGKHPCPTCRKRPPLCPPCTGSGTLLAPCPDCAGAGKLADPRRLDPSVCPWSGTASERACESCDEDGRVTLPCQGCGGHGRLPCETCQGLARVPCPGCGGRGRLPSGSCLTCDRKGFLACLACAEGSRPCEGCGGARAITASCPHCGGSGHHACNGCADGAYAAWEHAAAWCLALERPDRAAPLLEVALRRCEARYAATSYPPRLTAGEAHFDPVLSSLLGRGGEKTRRAFQEAREREQQDELGRLSALLRKVRLAAR